MFSHPEKYRAKAKSQTTLLIDQYFDHPISSLIVILSILFFIGLNTFQYFDSRSSTFIPKENTNQILYEQDGTILVPIKSQSRLNDSTKDALIAIRQDAIAPYLALGIVAKNYRPSDIVFGRLKSNLPWYGMDNFYRLGPSSNEHQGDSVESLAITNPLLLVVPEFWGISIWGEGKKQWRDIAIPPTKVLAPTPNELKWSSQSRQATVRYDISQHLENVNQYLVTPLTVTDVDFGVSAYNALDLGFHYMRFAPEKSASVEAEKGTTPTPILDYLGAMKEVCGMPCNHRSNPMPEFDTLKISSIPAKAVFELWKIDNTNEAIEIPMRTPDFSFIIDIK